LVLVLLMQITVVIVEESMTPGFLATLIFILMIFPLPMILFVKRRSKKTKAFREKQHEELVELAADAVDVGQNYRLIADYRQRPQAVLRFSQEISEYNATHAQSARIKINNEYAAPWTSNVVCGAWMIIGGMQVLAAKEEDRLPIGTFLLTLNVIRSMGKEYNNIYSAYLIVQTSFPALTRVTKMLNLSTDLGKRQDINLERRETGKKMLEEARAEQAKQIAEAKDSAFAKELTDLFPVDFVPLTATGVSFAWREQEGLESQFLDDSDSDAEGQGGAGGQEGVKKSRYADLDKTKANGQEGTRRLRFTEIGKKAKKQREFKIQILDDFNCTIKQGEMVALTGPHGGGKSTVLQLFGQVIVPDTGQIFVPPHLRILHVPLEAYFKHGTLMQNLFFGRNIWDADGKINEQEVKRGKAIWKKLGGSDSLWKTIRWDKTTDRFKMLPRSARTLINIARALIFNPEVLIMHQPTLALTHDQQEKVMLVLKEFVENRGLGKDGPPWLRRPRTLLYSTLAPAGFKLADRVLRCDHGTTVTELGKDEVTQDVLQMLAAQNVEGAERQKIQGLEIENEALRERVRKLERKLARDGKQDSVRFDEALASPDAEVPNEENEECAGTT